MGLSSEHKQEVTRYLLGTAAVDEQAALEDKYFSDPGFFEQVVAVEKELLDDYARDRLSADERGLFERHYLSHSKRRSRAMAASALATKLNRLSHPKVESGALSWRRNLFTGFHSRTLAFGMALATIMMALGIAWLWLESRRLRSELEQSQVARVAVEQRQKELQGLLDEQKDRSDRLKADLEKINMSQERPVTPSAPAFASLLLTAGMVREGDSTDAPRILVPPGAEQLRLQLKIGEISYRRYRLSVERSDGRMIRSFDNLKPSSGKIFTIALPITLFTDGEYVLVLNGRNDNGEVDQLSKSLFRVESKTPGNRH